MGKVSQFQFAIYASYAGFLFAGFFELSMQRIWVSNAFFLLAGFALLKEKKMNPSFSIG